MASFCKKCKKLQKVVKGKKKDRKAGEFTVSGRLTLATGMVLFPLDALLIKCPAIYDRFHL